MPVPFLFPVNLHFQTPGHPINDSDITALESQIACSLPEDYRKFLREMNGGKQPDRDMFSIGDGETTFLKELYSLKNGVPFELSRQISGRHARGVLARDLIPIGLDAYGNDICLGVGGDRRGEVYFHYHDRGKADPDDEFEPVYFIAHTFTDFVRALRIDPSKVLHDEIEIMGQMGGRTDLVNFISQGKSLEKLNKYNRTIAQEAARHGNLNLLQACHDHGANLKGVIHMAALNGHGEVITYLLDNGVDVNERDKNGKTALTLAFRLKDIVVDLIKRGATK